MADSKIKKAVVLAGTTPHIDLINKLKQRGFFTILVDYNPKCPARPYADKFICESNLDKEKVLRITKEEQADIIISIVGDHINAVLCYVAEELGLPHPYTYEMALKSTQKSLMKPLFKENCIDTPDYYVLSYRDKREIKLDFPLVVKPSDANSSKGVFRVNNQDEFLEKIEESFAVSREKKVIVEKYIGGTEIQVDCLAIDDKAYICRTMDMVPMPANGFELQTMGFAIPGELCSSYLSELQAIADKIMNVYHLHSGAFFYQAKIEDGKIYVLEAASRMAGGASFNHVSITSGMDYMDLSLKCFFGNTINEKPHMANNKYIGRCVNAKPCIFDHIEGVEKMIEDNIIINAIVLCENGERISESHMSSNRICTFLISCETYEEGYRKMKIAEQYIRVFSVEGEDVTDYR